MSEIVPVRVTPATLKEKEKMHLPPSESEEKVPTNPCPLPAHTLKLPRYCITQVRFKLLLWCWDSESATWVFYSPLVFQTLVFKGRCSGALLLGVGPPSYGLDPHSSVMISMVMISISFVVHDMGYRA